ncbi:hypothetical protein BJG89_14135 (plasmid) [Staphylococcus nepalensis]|uniref:BppU family phage baseplate upper protein n=1 Tax=Staphylococcus nepalensis TaxID=214473 RepID=UPI000BC31E88|nr:BppU family phage baseplate upper protein [Staphylococcus nepalensis]ATH60376.1 hypothetical protein BJD96_08710 [Staphylococcus nepalensis]ATH65425.1 hypothetical protein BJG89_08815 [Staphylococcus nepalensis]ATH66496.1 hypothetical protein BJG89_14135 [Staphylococcus nepalensis]
MNNLEKIGRLKANILPKESTIGKGILAYYSADNNTSVIRLQVNRENGNLLLGEPNVCPMISLFFADKSKYINQEMNIVDPFTGTIEYTLTDEQLEKTGDVKVVVTIERKGSEDRVYVCDFTIAILDSGIETLEPNEVVIQVGNVVQLRKQLQELEGKISLAEESLLRVINDGLSQLDNKKQEVNKSFDETLEQIETKRANVLSEFNGAITDVDNVANNAIEIIENNQAVKLNDYNNDKKTINNDINESLNLSKSYTDEQLENANTEISTSIEQKSKNAESNAKVYTDNLISRVDSDIANNRVSVTPFTDITFKNGFSNVTDTVKWSVYRTISHGNGLIEIELFINVKGPFAVGRNVVGVLSNNIAPKKTFSVGGRGSDNEPLSLQIGVTGEIAVYVKNTTTYADGKINYYLI